MISLFVAGEPVAQGSMRGFTRPGGKVGMTSSNERTLKPWRAVLSAALQDAVDEVLTGPVAVTLTFLLRRPKSVSVRKRPYPHVRPDIDKLARAVLDAMTGTMIADDSQVISLILSKHYAEEREQTGVGILCSEHDASTLLIGEAREHVG